MRECKVCGKEISKSRRGRHAVYCSHACYLQFMRENYRKTNPSVESVPPGTKGVMSEYRVTLDLLAKGYEVFNAVSPSSSCDLAVLKDHKLTRIEVRTGYITTGGNPMCSKNHKADVLAIVLKDDIVYEPPLE